VLPITLFCGLACDAELWRELAEHSGELLPTIACPTLVASASPTS
jgi:hypothetical protein